MIWKMIKFIFYFIIFSVLAFFSYQVFQGKVYLFDTHKFFPKENIIQAVFNAWKNGSVCDKISNPDSTNYIPYDRLNYVIHPCLVDTFFQELWWNIKERISKTDILSPDEISVLFKNTEIESQIDIREYSADFGTGWLILKIPSSKFDSYWIGNRNIFFTIPILEKYAVKAEQNYVYSIFNRPENKSEIEWSFYRTIGEYIYYRDYSELLEWFTKLTTSCYGHNISGSWSNTINWSNSAAIAFEKTFADIAQGKPFQKTEQYSEAQYQFVLGRYFQHPTQKENKADISLVLANKKKYESSSYLGCREFIKNDSDITFKIFWNSDWIAPENYKDQILDLYDRVLYVLYKQRHYLSDDDIKILKKFVLNIHFEFSPMVLESITETAANDWYFLKDGDIKSIQNLYLHQDDNVINLYLNNSLLAYNEAIDRYDNTNWEERLWLEKWIYDYRITVNDNGMPTIDRNNLLMKYNKAFFEYKQKNLTGVAMFDISKRDLRSKDEQMEQLFYHEIGHYLNFKNYKNFKEIYDKFNNICWDRNWKIKNDISGDAFVSTYAKTKPTEDFAETFKIFILYKWIVDSEIEKCKSTTYKSLTYLGKKVAFVDFEHLSSEWRNEEEEKSCVLSPQLIKKFQFIDTLRLN